MTNKPRIERLPDNPIIHPAMDPGVGDNVNGPSLIRAPDWVNKPLGQYYLYFAHHNGDHIRMAYSDSLHGPWKIFTGGVMSLSQSGFRGHIASPDVHVDHQQQRIRMYFHGADADSDDNAPQSTRLALSQDGLSFNAVSRSLGPAYFRVFRWQAYYYAIAMPGVVYRSTDGIKAFEKGQDLGVPNMRHCAVKVVNDRLQVCYSNIGDCPESILYSTIDLEPDWLTWTLEPPHRIVSPQRDYEGAHQPLQASVVGMAHQPVHQLRDPDIFSDAGDDFLLYSVAGEQGIAIARLFTD